MPVAAAGFLAFFALERYAAMSGLDHDAHVGALSAGGLCAHSFLDVVAIEVGFEKNVCVVKLA